MIVVNELKGFFNAIPAKNKKYWNLKKILNKVKNYSKIHHRSKYKYVFSMPTKTQRIIFKLLDISDRKTIQNALFET